MPLRSIEPDLFRIELPMVLSDSTHGQISHFELGTVRLRDEDGIEGLGYSYTVGAGGRAIRALIEHDLTPLLEGQDGTRIEQLWHGMWWRLHFVGRGGLVAFAMAAVDIALWDLRARRAGLPLWRLLGGHDPRVPAYAGGIDLEFPLEKLLRQTEASLERGFRAIKMKVGRPQLSEDVARIEAMGGLLGPDFPLMVDANMRWRVDEAIRASRAFSPHDIFWLEEPTIPDESRATYGSRARRPCRSRPARTSTAPRVRAHDGSRRRRLPRARLRHARRHHALAQGRARRGAAQPSGHLARRARSPRPSPRGVPNRSYLEVHGFGLERFMAEPLEVRDGIATAPERPGHGVSLDWQALEPCRVRARGRLGPSPYPSVASPGRDRYMSGAAEGWPSGLRRTPGKRVGVSPRGFKSRSLRQE